MKKVYLLKCLWDYIFVINLNINSLSCRCSKNQLEDEEDVTRHGRITFTLVNIEQRKFNNLIPDNENYIYMKILYNEVIFNASSKPFIEMPFGN